MERIIQFNEKEIQLSLNEPIHRFSQNPILTAEDINRVWRSPVHQVVTVHNAGVSFFKGKTYMLFRSHLRNGISVIGLASSENGLGKWQVSPEPVLKPATRYDKFSEGVDPNQIIEAEAGGVEDPRISLIEGVYYITYSAYSATVKNSVKVSLATTQDFKSFTRHGFVSNHDMRNVVIFPKKINDKYYCLLRPNDDIVGDIGGIYKKIDIASSDDISSNNWKVDSEPIMQVADGPGAFCDKIGPGATPIETKYGWLNIFHGVRNTMDGNPYVLGVGFHDLENPNLFNYSTIPVLFPSAADCRVNEQAYVHVPNVVFTCGATRRNDGVIYIYYGGNDTVMNLCVSHEDILFNLCQF